MNKRFTISFLIFFIFASLIVSCGLESNEPKISDFEVVWLSGEYPENPKLIATVKIDNPDALFQDPTIVFVIPAGITGIVEGLENVSQELSDVPGGVRVGLTDDAHVGLMSLKGGDQETFEAALVFWNELTESGASHISKIPVTAIIYGTNGEVERRTVLIKQENVFMPLSSGRESSLEELESEEIIETEEVIEEEVMTEEVMETIEIPNLVGMYSEVAVTLIEDMGLIAVVEEGESNLDLGVVYEQSPNAGNIYEVNEISQITIYKTLGSSKVYIEEEFNDPSIFTSTEPSNVFIDNGQVVWNLTQSNPNDQYIFRSIPEFSGNVKIIVKGQINTNQDGNHHLGIGIGDSYGEGPNINFGNLCRQYYVGARGVNMYYTENHCELTGWLLIDNYVPYVAEFMIVDGDVVLTVEGIGRARGDSDYSGIFDTLWIGGEGGKNPPSVSGTIDYVIIEQLD